MMIAAYRRHGFPQEALALFHQMQQTDTQPDQFIFASMLSACSKIGALEVGMEIHQRIVEIGFLSDVVIGNALIDMYAKCGSIHKARDLFDKMHNANVVSWTAMITGYTQDGDLDEAFRIFKRMPQRDAISWTAVIAGHAQNGLGKKALEIFKQMQLAGVKPISTTYVAILTACVQMEALKQGIEIHQIIIESGLLSNSVIVTALIDVYAKCGSLYKAHKLFDSMYHPDTITWTVMVSGNAQNGHCLKACEVFKQMQSAGVKPNSATFASILPACAKLRNLEQGMEIHQKIIESRFFSHIMVGNALIDMYAKCGSIQKARELFDKMLQRDVVSWNAIIGGHAQNGLVEEVLDICKQMQLVNVKPNTATFAIILPACAKLGALEHGTEIHQKIIEIGFLSNVVVVNALIDMYAKSGCILQARKLFDKIQNANLVSWTAMISGYAMHGYKMDALKLFEQMRHSGIIPDSVSFVCILFACSHAGLVDEGCKYFNCIRDSYCIMHTMDHYVCMVDLLGRAGYLESTLNFIIKMPIKPDGVVWMCFLGACRSHKHTGLGQFAAAVLFELDFKTSTPYVLLSNLYAEVGRWGDAQKTRKLMDHRGIKKIPGWSWI
ncbi:pentatricopeptide repeat-containing protein At2g13600-like isoform X2 [Cryptomeria japonica]|nr:pentatricopeptide repeat-containing protein At2g13600-like isoform X2 [Cryptomeria japonica]